MPQAYHGKVTTQGQSTEVGFSVLDRPDTVARLFLGLPVPLLMRTKLAEAARQHFGTYFGALLPEENWHLTLFFFGDVKNHAQYLGRLQQPLPQAFVPTISLTHLGRGAQRHQLWAYVNPTPALLSLRENLSERLRKIHFPLPIDSKKFIPHIHLANFYPTVSGLGLADVSLPAVYATQEAHLYQSTSTPQGSHYDAIATIAFGNRH